eukprot:Hpha_TRINITY_DN5934_c0_g1::TRINITY_DN5934_c0_g1_i2::g.147317::m.147317
MATPRNDTVGGDWTERLFITLWSPLAGWLTAASPDQNRRHQLMIMIWCVQGSFGFVIFLLQVISLVSGSKQFVPFFFVSTAVATAVSVGVAIMVWRRGYM